MSQQFTIKCCRCSKCLTGGLLALALNVGWKKISGVWVCPECNGIRLKTGFYSIQKVMKNTEEKHSSLGE